MDPDKISLWIKLYNLPLEAWTLKGISAIASRLGNPIIMDSVTAKMCQEGRGKTGFARVLIEVNAQKGFQENIEINYKHCMNTTTVVKYVKVKYMWKPKICNDCQVFGHGKQECKKNKHDGEANKEEPQMHDTPIVQQKKNVQTADKKVDYGAKDDGNTSMESRTKIANDKSKEWQTVNKTKKKQGNETTLNQNRQETRNI